MAAALFLGGALWLWRAPSAPEGGSEASETSPTSESQTVQDRTQGSLSRTPSESPRSITPIESTPEESESDAGPNDAFFDLTIEDAEAAGVETLVCQSTLVDLKQRATRGLGTLDPSSDTDRNNISYRIPLVSDEGLLPWDAIRFVVFDGETHLVERTYWLSQTRRASLRLSALVPLDVLVVDENQTPMDGARIEVFALEDSSSVGEATTDEKGEATLILGSIDGPLLAVASKSGFRPGARQTWSSPASVGAKLQLTLQSPLTVSGTVVSYGKPHAGARVAVSLVEENVTSLGGFAWFQGQAEVAFAKTRTDEHGRYTFEGLGPWRYRLSVGNAPHVPTHADFEVERTVIAPASSVDFDVSGATFRMSLQGPEGPIYEAALTMMSERGKIWIDVRNQSPMISLLVRPSTHYRLQVEHDQFRLFDRELFSPEVGEILDVAVSMEPRDIYPALRFEFVGDNVPSLDSVPFSLVAVDVYPRETPAREISRRHFTNLKAHRQPDGTYLAANLSYTPGIYRVRVDPRCEGGELFLADEMTLDLRNGDTTIARCPLHIGSGAQVFVTNQEGALIDAHAELLNQDGEAVSAIIGKDPEHPNVLVLQQPVLPREYLLRVRAEGYISTLHPISMDAGDIHDVHVVLIESS